MMSASKMAVDSDLREFFRRSGAHPDRKGQLRKDAFQRLLSLAKTSNDEHKALVMEFMQDYFADFPDMQDAAINVVYDMCEDQDQEIRIAGYSAITSVSKVEKAWLVRNADVLVQLLQIDDMKEVAFVKRALQEHVDLDARGTLRVLIDQCTFDPSTITDPDERDLRIKLRNLVLEFLSEKYKICIARAVRNSSVEEIVLKGIIETIPRISSGEVNTIVKNVLINLPSLSNGPTQRGDAVLDAVLAAAHTSLKSELATSSTRPSDLKRSISFLSLANFLISPSDSRASLASGRNHHPYPVRHTSLASPQQLLRGYIALLTPETQSGAISGSVLADNVTPAGFQDVLAFVRKTIDATERTNGISRNLREQFIANAFPSLTLALRKQLSLGSAVEKDFQSSCLRIMQYVYEHLNKLSAADRMSFRPILTGLVSLESELRKKAERTSTQVHPDNDWAVASIVVKKLIDLLDQPLETGTSESTRSTGASLVSRVNASNRRDNTTGSSSTSLSQRVVLFSVSSGSSSLAGTDNFSMRGAANKSSTSAPSPSVAPKHEDDAMDVDTAPVSQNGQAIELVSQPARKRLRSGPSEVPIASTNNGKPSLLSRMSGQKSSETLPLNRSRSSGSPSAMNKDAPLDLRSRLGLSPSSQPSSGRNTPIPKQRDDRKKAQRPNILRNRLDGGVNSLTAPAPSFRSLSARDSGEISIRGAAQREADSESGFGEKSTLMDRLQMQSQTAEAGLGGRKRKLGLYNIS